jgi:N-acetylglucosaminyldiphosphoundecaprenol N-acetyl-beta-D-mannosaminyltransferase
MPAPRSNADSLPPGESLREVRPIGSSVSRASSGSPAGESPRFRLGSVSIDRLSLPQALEAIEALVAARRGGSVFTPNIDHVVLADENAAFRAAYAAASLSLVDGAPLLWASRLWGPGLPEKVSGSDLVWPLLERAGQRGWRVFLTGAGPGVAEAAAERVRRELSVHVVGTDSPRIALQPGSPDSSDESEAAAERVAAARPDLVLVGFGAPKQEQWIHRFAPTLGPAVAFACGAGIDFLAGRVRRAPRWISRAGLEWAFRLAQEPRRLWRRYLVQDPKFLFILLRELRARPPWERGVP